MRINKSVKYYKKNNDTFKVIKHNNDTIEVFKLKDTSKNQNSWTIKDYKYFNDYNSIKDFKTFLLTYRKNLLL